MAPTSAPTARSATRGATGPAPGATVLQGDSLQLLATVAPASVDAVVCDPPYGIDFCGHAWDGQAIRHAAAGLGPGKLAPNEAFEAWSQVWAAGCLRALKPGAHLAAFGSPRTFHRLGCALEQAGFELRDTLLWLYGTGMPKSRHLPGGRATQLKPAYEPILLARKPLDGTVEHNHARHGTGALNTDACRVDGRFPANVILAHDPDCTDEQCTPDCPVRLVDQAARPTRARGAWPISRLFYCPKASRRERDAGCEQLPRRHLDLFPNAQGAGQHPPPTANPHPTVKPLALMRWLVRLIVPQDGLVLDPFCGSGSTGCAAALEQRRFLGIELDADYAEIARARITHWHRHPPPAPPAAPVHADPAPTQSDGEHTDSPPASPPPRQPAPATSPPSASALDADSVERVAQRVLELLAPRLDASPAATGRLLTAAEVSERWGVERSWIYEHAAELGAIRLGSGPRPRLRFRPEAIDRHPATLTATHGPSTPQPRPKGRAFRPIPGDPVELLPIRGQAELTSPETTTDRPGGAPTPPATAPKTTTSAR